MIIQEKKRNAFEIEILKNHSKDGFEIFIDIEGFEENISNFKNISKKELQKIINELQKLCDSVN